MKCPFCAESVKEENDLEMHIEMKHDNELEGKTPKQIIYHEKNKYKNKNIGICSCGKPKAWNESKNKYEHFCGSEEHNAKLRQEYENNMMTTYGTANPAELPEHQVAMMEGRSIAKRIQYGKTEFVVLSEVEAETLRQLQKLNFPESDLEAPSLSVNIPYEMPPDYKKRNHIPDIFVKSLNLLISCKDSVDNPNMHPNFKKDRFKSLYQYQAILNNTEYNFIQVEGVEDAKNIPMYIAHVKKAHSSKSRYVIPPRVDCFVLMNESFFLDTLVLNEQGYILTSESMNGKGFIINEEGQLVITGINKWNGVKINANMIAENYIESDKIQINDLEAISYFLSNKNLLNEEVIQECFMDVIE